ncbi:MAG: GNAT family N-acetyltransferase [Actinomycetota bacterium]
MMHQQSTRGEYEISTDPSRIDLPAVHSFLTHSYWATGIPLETVSRSLRYSLCFGIYKRGRQAGFARVVSDYATFAYLADVFVLPEHRSQGLAKWLMECIMAHPDLQGLRRWSLATRDAHGLYRQFGFKDLKHPEAWMERHDPEVYGKARESGVQQD